MKISVIIPSYNRPDILLTTLKGLKKVDFSDYEIIVVDNACSSSVRETVEKESRNNDGGRFDIIYVEEPNIGLHNARNTGAKAARAEILLYIDDDMVVDKNLLREIIKPYSSSEIACVGGKILPLWEIQPPPWITQVHPGVFGILDLGDKPKLLNTPSLWGGNLSIKRNILFQMGGFNPDAFADPKLLWMRGDGETGLLRKVLKSGYRICYAPDAICQHYIPQEYLSLEYIKRRLAREGMSASYADYRENQFNSLKLAMRSLGLMSYAASSKILSLVKKRLNDISWYRNALRSSYAWSRSMYELRLIFDKNLKNHALRNDWFEHH